MFSPSFAGGGFPTPAVAAANGLNTQALFDDFLGTSTIDLSKTGNPGFNWYLNCAWPNASPTIFGGWSGITTAAATNSSNIKVANSLVTLSNAGPFSGAGSTAGLQVQTAQASGSSYVGKGFTPPMYVECSVRFVPSNADSAAWPIPFWFTPLEFFTGSVTQFTEVDGFEYYLGQVQYMNVHHWNMATQVRDDLSTQTITGFTDSNFHKIGLLWLPAAGATNGVIKRYFDGIEQTGADYSYASGSEGAASDTLTNMLILASGDNIPVTWDYIGVWT